MSTIQRLERNVLLDPPAVLVELPGYIEKQKTLLRRQCPESSQAKNVAGTIARAEEVVKSARNRMNECFTANP